MSTHIAIREQRPIVADTPADPNELHNELRDLESHLHLTDVLAGCGTGMKMVERDLPKGKYHSYLMILDSQKRSTDVTAYALEGLTQAQEDYLNLEKENVDKPWIQSVLVSVDSIAALKRAYPNFYLDSYEFISAVNRAVGEQNGKK